ncbi:hypothetical protein AOLI_G00163690 [Acnodon oligacanthus]
MESPQQSVAVVVEVLLRLLSGPSALGQTALRFSPTDDNSEGEQHAMTPQLACVAEILQRGYQQQLHSEDAGWSLQAVKKLHQNTAFNLEDQPLDTTCSDLYAWDYASSALVYRLIGLCSESVSSEGNTKEAS